MTSETVTATDEWSYRGNRAVVLENEYLKLSVFPELGAKIYDILYKPFRRNLLWHHPRIYPHKVPLGTSFDDVWCGGWDEIFPNDAPCIVEGQRYHDMGEAWSIPWEYSIARDTDTGTVTLFTTTMTPIMACKLTRALTIRDGEPSVYFRYVLENTGYDALKFLWKIHPAFQINESCRIEIPARTGIVDPRYRDLYSESSNTYRWPKVNNRQGETIDLSRVPPPTARTCSLHYVTDLDDGVVTLQNPRDNIDLKIRFNKQILNTVWLFLAYGGYRSLYTAVIEPSTSYPYDLAQAISEGHYSRLEPGKQLNCDIDVQLSEHFNSP